MDTDTAGVVAQLKGLNPMSLIAYLVDGETKNIAVPQVRRKWSHLRKVIDVLPPWARLEALDKKGNVTAIIENPKETDELMGDLYLPTKTTGEVGQLLALMLKGQDVALQRQAQMLKTVLENNAAMLQTVSARLGMLEKNYMENLELVQDFAQAAAAAASGGGEHDEAWKAVADLAPHFPALLKAGRQMSGGNSKPPKTAAKK